ncbi:MAG TPA: low molecular weight protein-tyrosine-phosphatase [Nocardioidaceae bacterium]|jgi:protein-tyrosine phosphatase
MTSPTAQLLPEPSDAGSAYTIALVCLGNICRSPTAQVVLTKKLADAGLDEKVTVRSAGTGTWHIDEAMDHRSAALLTAGGYDPTLHRATLFDKTWFGQYDLVLVMDHHNLRDVQQLATTAADMERIMMFRAFDPAADESLDVPDPWFGDEDRFEDVLTIVERTSDALVTALRERLATNS